MMQFGKKQEITDCKLEIVEGDSGSSRAGAVHRIIRKKNVVDCGNGSGTTVFHV